MFLTDQNRIRSSWMVEKVLDFIRWHERKSVKDISEITAATLNNTASNNIPLPAILHMSDIQTPQVDGRQDRSASIIPTIEPLSYSISKTPELQENPEAELQSLESTSEELNKLKVEKKGPFKKIHKSKKFTGVGLRRSKRNAAVNRRSTLDLLNGTIPKFALDIALTRHDNAEKNFVETSTRTLRRRC